MTSSKDVFSKIPEVILEDNKSSSKNNLREDLIDMMFHNGSLYEALLYSNLFVPPFLEIDDAVFLNDGTYRFPEDYNKSLASSTLGKLELLLSFNRREIPYMFSETDIDISHCYLLAGLIAEAWDARLKKLFPAKKFFVRVSGSNVEGGGVFVEFEQW